MQNVLAETKRRKMGGEKKKGGKGMKKRKRHRPVKPPQNTNPGNRKEGFERTN